jgi:hypothetical protein
MWSYAYTTIVAFACAFLMARKVAYGEWGLFEWCLSCVLLFAVLRLRLSPKKLS